MKEITIKDIQIFILTGIVLLIGYGDYHLEALTNFSSKWFFTVFGQFLSWLTSIITPDIALFWAGVIIFYYLVTYQKKSISGSFVIVFCATFILGRVFNTPIEENINTVYLIMIYTVPQVINLLVYLILNSIHCLISEKKEGCD